ncbi:MAG: hypothetical protein ACYDCS_00845 [Candidatus Dormibacteria bacterium]
MPWLPEISQTSGPDTPPPLADGAGISLEHCSLTDDGVAVALEYNCGLWGRTPIPLQAGVAVYKRGTTGRLAAARIYDDVAPPGISDSSRTQLVE